MTSPTMPVAPTTPMRAPSVLMVVPPLRVRVAEVERRMQRAHRVLHRLLRHVAGDLDRRGRDDGGGDPEGGGRRRRLRRAAGGAAAACADGGEPGGAGAAA